MRHENEILLSYYLPSTNLCGWLDWQPRFKRVSQYSMNAGRMVMIYRWTVVRDLFAQECRVTMHPDYLPWPEAGRPFSQTRDTSVRYQIEVRNGWVLFIGDLNANGGHVCYTVSKVLEIWPLQQEVNTVAYLSSIHPRVPGVYFGHV